MKYIKGQLSQAGLVTKTNFKIEKEIPLLDDKLAFLNINGQKFEIN